MEHHEARPRLRPRLNDRCRTLRRASNRMLGTIALCPCPFFLVLKFDTVDNSSLRTQYMRRRSQYMRHLAFVYLSHVFISNFPLFIDPSLLSEPHMVISHPQCILHTRLWFIEITLS